MDANSQRTSQDVPLSSAHGTAEGGLVAEGAIHPAACTLCRRILSPDGDDLEIISICGDCKFLLLEDLGASTHESPFRRHHRRRRTAHSSSESIDNLFSQQLSQMFSMVRQNQMTASSHEDQSIDGDTSARMVQRTSTHTTPSGSRTWRRVPSDTESEGFDNLDSLYAETETNLSLSRYRVFHGESDTVSFSVYGGESDASVDGHSFLDAELFIQPDEGSNFDSDTDIDPMHAGLGQWNSDDAAEDEDEEEEDGEWEEADIEDVEVESVGASEGNHLVNWPWLHSPQIESLIDGRSRQGRQTYNHSIFANLEESGLPRYIQNSGVDLDARGFEELLEHLAEIDSSRRGAPPASVSFVNSLPRIVIRKEHEKHDGLACAICKDVLPLGTEVNQLPCLHVYHPSCILPWLSARNSCPLCRYELPTDDKDYEDGKQHISGGMRIHEFQQQDFGEQSSLVVSNGVGADAAQEFDRGMEQRGHLDIDPTGSSGGEGSRRRWFFLAAAPIVSFVGIVLVLWLGNPQGRHPSHYSNFPERGTHQIHLPSSSELGQRASRSRRWWSLF